MAIQTVRSGADTAFAIEYTSIGGMIEVYTFGWEEGDSLEMHAKHIDVYDTEGTLLDTWTDDIANGELNANCVSRIPLHAGTAFRFSFTPKGGLRTGSGLILTFSQERAPA